MRDQHDESITALNDVYALLRDIGRRHQGSQTSTAQTQERQTKAAAQSAAGRGRIAHKEEGRPRLPAKTARPAAPARANEV